MLCTIALNTRSSLSATKFGVMTQNSLRLGNSRSQRASPFKSRCHDSLVRLIVEAVSQIPWINSTAVQTAATIQAQPNPVPAGDGLGTTTIVWKTGDGSQGQVYVSEDGAEDKLFDAGTEGSTPAPWIRAASTYEFRLYAGTNHKTLLGSVKVTRAT